MQGWGRKGRQGDSCAPGTRTIKMCSFDRRSGTSTGAIPRERETRKLGMTILLPTIHTASLQQAAPHIEWGHCEMVTA